MISRKEVVMQYINNKTSAQTGEELSLGFLQNRATSRVAPAMLGVTRNHKKRVGVYDTDNHRQSYEDLAGVLGSPRINSECGSDAIESASAKGLMENGIRVNNEFGLRNDEKASWHGLSKDSNGTGHDQVGLGISARRLTKSELGQCSQPSASGVSAGSQSAKVKLLCSFAGNVMPRPSDGKLRYVGGETRIISIRKDISWEKLVKKTSEICNQPHTIKYQLPGEDLDALISVSSYEDLQNMLEEYYSIQKLGDSQRLRIFLIPLSESEKSSAIDPTITQQGDPNYQYVVAINGVTGIHLNPQEYCNEQSLASDISPLAPVFNQNAGFQANSLSSGNPSQIVNGLDFRHPTEFINEPQDTTRHAKQYAPLSPVIVQQGDVNDYTQFPKEKLSPGSSTGSILVSTAMLPPEASGNNIIPYYAIPQVAGNLVNLSDNASKNDVVQTNKVVGPPSHVYNLNRETLISPVLESNNSNFQECSFDRPVTDQRIFHSEKHLSHPDDVMGVLLASENSTCLNHRMPHTFSDSKLQEYGGSSTYSSYDRITPSFSLNLETPQLSMLADLREKPIQQHKTTEIFNPYLQSEVLNMEPVGSNKGVNCRNAPLGPEFISKSESVHWDVHGNNEKCQLAKSKSHKHKSMMKEPEEKLLSCELKNDNCGHFHGNKPPLAAVEVMNLMPCVSGDQVPHVGLNNLKQNIQVHGCAVPASHVPSIDVKMEHNLNKQLASSRTPRGEPQSKTSCAMNLETVGVVHNSEEKSYRANCTTSLITELGVGAISVDSSMQIPIACPKAMVLNEPVVMNCPQSFPSAVLDDSGPTTVSNSSDTNNLNQDAAFRREYSLLGEDYIYNGDQHVENCGENNCLSEKPKAQRASFSKFQKSAALVEEVNISTAESPTSQHQVDIVHCDVPVPSPTEAEITLQELASENENSNYQRIKESITDAMIAEKEAGAYGLQIIKNANLEELRELGSGTYGTVYHGRWRGSDVAIKRIRKTCFSGRSSEQERLIKDFWREAQILSNLHHPNVVALYGVVPDGAGGTLATVTEYMAHGSLRSVLLKKDRFLDGHRKLMIAMDAAFGMEYLHSRNIIHFDLKCDNLLVDLRDPQQPICKVGDFGLSKIKRNTLVTGGIRGTLPWMAPELLNGSTNLVSEKVDVFSFGIAMWEILTGQEPYANMHYGAIIGGIVKNTLRPPIPERCDPEWRKLMERCWLTEPEWRPTFSEITHWLRSMSASLRG